MKKKIFINDQNRIVECQIYIAETQVQAILSYASQCSGKELELVRIGKTLLKENDKIRLSRAIRDLSDFVPELEYSKAIKHQLVDAIVLESYDYNSALLNEEEMNNIVFLRRFRNFIQSKMDNKEDTSMEFDDSFNKAIDKRINKMSELDKMAFDGDVSSSTSITEEEKEQYRLTKANQLPYTKK